MFSITAPGGSSGGGGGSSMTSQAIPTAHLASQHEAVVAVNLCQVQPGGIRQENPGEQGAHNAGAGGAVEGRHGANLRMEE